MCKLFCITGKLKQRQIAAALTAANAAFLPTEKDGFGFVAAAGKRVARGRFLFPSQYGGYMAGLPKRFVPYSSEENRIPIGTDTLIIHGRTSTNARGLEHTHPFQKGNLFLAHNGIVRWTGDKDLEPTPVCDSEQVLHWLAANDMDFDGLEEVFAGFGAIALYDAATGILTVAKDGASLYVARRSGDAGWVMATTIEILTKVCRRARISIDTNPVVFPKCVMTFKSGSILSDDDWKGFGNRPWSSQDFVSYGHGNAASTYGNVNTGAVVPYKSAQESGVVFTREGRQVNQQGELVPLGTSPSALNVKKGIFPEEIYDQDDLDEDEIEEGVAPDGTEVFDQADETPLIPLEEDEITEEELNENFPDWEGKTYPKKCHLKNATEFFDSSNDGAN